MFQAMIREPRSEFEWLKIVLDERDELRAEVERLTRLLDAFHDGILPDVRAENERLMAAMQKACDLLAERQQGSPTRSAGHNARLYLEAALEPKP